MITKNNLLEMLSKSLANEDEFILQYGEDFSQRVGVDESLSEEAREDILELMQSILKDTFRHKDVLTKLISQVKEDNKNEF